jgi:hypothetical protein
VAFKYPGKLRELQELFWTEAQKYQVLPLDLQSCGRRGSNVPTRFNNGYGGRKVANSLPCQRQPLPSCSYARRMPSLSTSVVKQSKLALPRKPSGLLLVRQESKEW